MDFSIKLTWLGVKHVDAGFPRQDDSSFVNAALQSLFHVPAFVDFLENDEEHQESCTSLLNCLTCCLHRILKSMRDVGVAHPTLVLIKWKDLCRGLDSKQQQDPFEFLMGILMKLRLEYLLRSCSDTLSYDDLHNTPPAQMFGGCKKYNVSCQSCGAKCSFVEPFLSSTVTETQNQTFDEMVLAELTKNCEMSCMSCSVKLFGAPNSFEIPPYLLIKFFRTNCGGKLQYSLPPSFQLKGFKYCILSCVAKDNITGECFCVAMCADGSFRVFNDTKQTKRTLFSSSGKGMGRVVVPSKGDVIKQDCGMESTQQEQQSSQGIADTVLSQHVVTAGCKLVRSIATQTEVKRTDSVSVQVNEPLLAYDVCRKHSKFEFFTGLSPEDFLLLFQLLGGEQTIAFLKKNYQPDTPKKRLKRKLSCKDQLFMFLLRLRRGLPLEELAYMFGISDSYVGELCYTMTRHVFLTFKSMEKECFPSATELKLIPKPPVMMKFPNLRVILDGAFFRIQHPTNFEQQGNTYSNYKKTSTVLFVIGISPLGGTVYCSDGFEGNSSEKEVVLRSEIMKQLQKGDAVMTDRGFSLVAELQAIGVNLIKPPVLGDRSSLTAEEEIESRSIAAARIYVEHAIADIKDNRLLQGDIPLTLVPVLPNLVYIAAYMRNFRPSRISNKKTKHHVPK